MQCRARLLSGHVYFKIVSSTILPDELAAEWMDLYNYVSRFGPAYNDQGRVVASDVKNTISQMTKKECCDVVERIIHLKQKIEEEFNY